MGRVKLQIKKIENTTNRQVTFSKRRNGLIKKAYELSVLCDVDICLVMFSPSGRVSVFSGNKSMEDILARYVNLPEHERGRTLGKMRREVDHRTSYQESRSVSIDSQLEEIQQQLRNCKSQLDEAEKRLRIFEGNPSQLSTLCEVEFQEQVLEDALKRVRLRKQVLQDEYDSLAAQTASEVHLTPKATNMDGFIAENSTNMMNWISNRDPQVQILNFLDSNGLLPVRDQQQPMVEVLPQASSLAQGQNIQPDHHLSPCSVVEDDDNVSRPEFGRVINVNLSPWTEFYPAGLVGCLLP
ncbi:Transcription factor, MADS-box [Dillenia turbinata]|uniref:Transcription factor, MADS-box n=1 Tax=Dillenia turbinata TaxID=194707 RepID=A0AAN8ZMI3_9MAGN